MDGMKLVRCGRKINFECQMCGKCCLKFTLPIGFEDCSIIRERTNLPIFIFLTKGKSKSPGDNQIFETYILRTPCPFFNSKEKSCGINEFKPKVCALYPFVLSKDASTGKMIYEYDANCPGVNKGKKLDLFSLVPLWKKYHSGLNVFDNNPSKINELISENEKQEADNLLIKAYDELASFKIEHFKENTYAHSGIDFKLLEKINNSFNQIISIKQKRGIINLAFILDIYDLNNKYLGKIFYVNRRLEDVKDVVCDAIKIIENTKNISETDYGASYPVCIDAFDKPPVEDIDNCPEFK